jgi:flagellar protein FliS
MSNLTASPNAYRQGAVLAATPGELVVMLYDGARRFLRQANVAMREGQIERAHNTLRRAELIIAHLDGVLDFDQGEVSERLHAVYLFCLSHLNAARNTQDPGKLEEVSELLGELREAWAQVAEEIARA